MLVIAGEFGMPGPAGNNRARVLEDDWPDILAQDLCADPDLVIHECWSGDDLRCSCGAGSDRGSLILNATQNHF
jgi:hypothetical protein